MTNCFSTKKVILNRSHDAIDVLDKPYSWVYLNKTIMSYLPYNYCNNNIL